MRPLKLLDHDPLGLANWLTIFRIVLIPVFVTLLVYRRVATALGIFFLASLTDTLDGNLSFLQGQYNGNASDVQVQVGGGPATFCVAEAGADANADGCSRTGQTLSVNPTVAISVPPAQSATVRFRVTIN